MRKRMLLAIGVLTIVVLASAEPGGGVAGFGDVGDERYYTDAVQWMVDNEITTGTSATCFSPEDAITRGQAAAFLWRMEGRPEAAPHPFGDVNSAYQQAPVSWLSATGVTTGTTASSFEPGPEPMLALRSSSRCTSRLSSCSKTLTCRVRSRP